jgi:hypothetical protein
MLQALGVRDVVIAETASSALAEAKRKSFDVLICSFRLGVEQDVLRATREASPRTRSILISAYALASRGLAKNLGDAEVLETPFTGAELEAVLRRALGSSRGLRGEVQELSLVDILQMYHHSRQSIAISLSGPIPGRVRLSKGEIVHAESGALRGQAALSVLLGAETGMISTELFPSDHQTTIRGSFHSLVLEAIAEHDERRRTARPSVQDLEATTLSLAAGAPPLASTPLDLYAGRKPAALRPRLSSVGLALWLRQRPLLIVVVLAFLVAGGIYFTFGATAPDTGGGVGESAEAESHGQSEHAAGRVGTFPSGEHAGNAGAEGLVRAPTATAAATAAAVPAPSAPARAAQPAAAGPRPAPPARQGPAGATPRRADDADFDIRPER